MQIKENEVFRVYCTECDYDFYTPDDEVDYCPHCGKKTAKVIYPGIDTGIMYEVKEVD